MRKMRKMSKIEIILMILTSGILIGCSGETSNKKKKNDRFRTKIDSSISVSTEAGKYGALEEGDVSEPVKIIYRVICKSYDYPIALEFISPSGKLINYDIPPTEEGKISEYTMEYIFDRRKTVKPMIYGEKITQLKYSLRAFYHLKIYKNEISEENEIAGKYVDGLKMKGRVEAQI
jgi:hypothetical protein